MGYSTKAHDSSSGEKEESSDEKEDRSDSED
jgi:hypothetical protein